MRTPKWCELRYTEGDIPRLAEELPVPCAVKVVNGGSSIGVQLPDTREELEKALRELLSFGSRVVVEEKIVGRELTVPYQSGSEGAREICPAPITEEERALLGDSALRLHRALGLAVYSRADFILDRDGNAWCLEVNTLPGMTPNSLIPKAAAVEGLSYAELCQRIVELSLEARGIKGA